MAGTGVLNEGKGGFSLCGKDGGWAKGEQALGREGESKRDSGMYTLFGGSRSLLF